MSKTYIFLLVLLLVGCGDSPYHSNLKTTGPVAQFEETAINHGYGREYDAVSALGIRIRYSQKHLYEDYPPDMIDRHYLATIDCMNQFLSENSDEPVNLKHDSTPFVIFRDDPIEAYGYIYTTGLTYVDETHLILIHLRIWLRHEFIHHVLYINGLDSDPEHKSGIFTCG